MLHGWSCRWRIEDGYSPCRFTGSAMLLLVMIADATLLLSYHFQQAHPPNISIIWAVSTPFRRERVKGFHISIGVLTTSTPTPSLIRSDWARGFGSDERPRSMLLSMKYRAFGACSALNAAPQAANEASRSSGPGCRGRSQGWIVPMLRFVSVTNLAAGTGWRM